jgi:hypothetical protein
MVEPSEVADDRGQRVETIVWSSAAWKMPSISAANTVLSARPLRPAPSSCTVPVIRDANVAVK